MLDCPTLDHSKCTQLLVNAFEWVGGSACRYTYGYTLFFRKRVYRIVVSIEAVLVKDCEATYSADLGTSSKESYWDYNRGWPKWRKVPCCSLVRRGWVSPKRMAETVLNWSLTCLLLNTSVFIGSTFDDLAQTGRWLIFHHQYRKW